MHNALLKEVYERGSKVQRQGANPPPWAKKNESAQDGDKKTMKRDAVRRRLQMMARKSNRNEKSLKQDN